MLKRASFFHSHYTSAGGIAVIAGAMLALAALGALLVDRFATAEQERTQLEWQTVLSLAAVERSAEVDGWFEEKASSIAALADNLSVRLYLTELATSEEERLEGVAPEYLRILLDHTANQARFRPENLPEALPNNAAFPRTAGLAILDGNKQLIAATHAMPPLSGKLAEFVLEAGSSPRQYQDLFTQEDNAAPGVRMVAFLSPIPAVQSGEIIGYALGVAEIGTTFFAQLNKGVLPYTDADTLLVRLIGNQIEYLLPSTGEGGSALVLDAETPALASAALIRQKGGFVHATDYRGRDVLAFGVKLTHAPWYLVHTVETRSALAESRIRQALTAGGLVLATLLTLALLFAVWRHASSLRAERVAREYKELARRHSAQEKLLRLITDTQLSGMFIVDNEGILRFANRLGAELSGRRAVEIPGKPIDSVFGPHLAASYSRLAREAQERGETISGMRRRKTDSGTTIFHTDYIPLAQIPDPHSETLRAGTLVVENDITPTILEKERRERTLLNLVRTLTSVMDRVIPYCANHSARVARLSRIIALEMKLDRTLVRTVQFAGRLMNLGRIFLPKELFLKEGKLTADELRQINESLQASAELVGGIEFEGPITDTIRQAGERTDGSGFLGLKGEEILPSARILSVANTFVSMISHRAWRQGMTPAAALQALLQDAGTKYDRAVVMALGHYLENRNRDTGWLLDSGEAQ